MELYTPLIYLCDDMQTCQNYGKGCKKEVFYTVCATLLLTTILGGGALITRQFLYLIKNSCNATTICQRVHFFKDLNYLTLGFCKLKRKIFSPGLIAACLI